MTPTNPDIDFGPAAHVRSAVGAPTVMMVCEHASNRIPQDMDDLGLSEAARQSHIAWDPGAACLAQAVADSLDAVLVLGGVSRLVYDCNRAPEAVDAVPERSEVVFIPGNRSLSPADRAQRVTAVYAPFRAALQDRIARHRSTLKWLITIHSFNPIYNGQTREVEIGVLHGRDDRFATAMMQSLAPDFPFIVRLNQPYAAADGVAHTLDLHGAGNALPNVMLEVRNDLIADTARQRAMARRLVPWINAAQSRLEAHA